MPTQTEARESKTTPVVDGWRAIVLIAATYVYFLIFAQFGFLKHLAGLGLSGDAVKPIMAAMAAGGILASLVVARFRIAPPAELLRLSFIGCAAAAALSLPRLSSSASIGVAFFIGLSLGALTVTLVANLRLWFGTRRPLTCVGIGTGLGYWICNIPALFDATSAHIALAAILACGVGLFGASHVQENANPEPQTVHASQLPAFALMLIWLTALVWFDSAAFFTIQNSPALKSATWQGAAHLWRTGGVHFFAALVCVWLVARRGAALALLTAFACLAGAALLLLHPEHSSAAAVLYPAGVSLYSVVLVAYPSLLMPGATQAQRSRRAGWLYAIAGWIGSAMGIGMAQHLHRIPVGFIVVAAVLFLLPLGVQSTRVRTLEFAAIALVLLASWGIAHLLARKAPRASAAILTPAERGRRVYISQGCINCHSQYVRPHSRDVELWGPAQNLDAIRRETPPLIGNRREGPDLIQVGARRSPLWLRIHLIDPRSTSPGSPMPSYAGLFRDQRGEDLVAYLASLKSPDSRQRILSEAAAWTPSVIDKIPAERIDAGQLDRAYCATCHDSGGPIRMRWGAQFRHQPPLLNPATLKSVAAGNTPAERTLHFARIIKFGLPGTDMPGHEYMPDAQVEALARYLENLVDQ